MSWSDAVIARSLSERQPLSLSLSSLSQSQLDINQCSSSLKTLLPNPPYSKRLMSSKGHKHIVFQRCPPQHGRKAPMSRREACPFPLLLVSNYKSASSDPVGSYDIIIGRQEFLGLLPGPAEEAFISVPLLGTGRLNHFFYLCYSLGLMLSCEQSWVACAIPCCLFKLPPVVCTTSYNYS